MQYNTDSARKLSHFPCANARCALGASPTFESRTHTQRGRRVNDPAGARKCIKYKYISSILSFCFSLIVELSGARARGVL